MDILVAEKRQGNKKPRGLKGLRALSQAVFTAES